MTNRGGYGGEDTRTSRSRPSEDTVKMRQRGRKQTIARRSRREEFGRHVEHPLVRILEHPGDRLIAMDRRLGDLAVKEMCPRLPKVVKLARSTSIE